MASLELAKKYHDEINKAVQAGASKFYFKGVSIQEIKAYQVAVSTPISQQMISILGLISQLEKQKDNVTANFRAELTQAKRQRVHEEELTAYLRTQATKLRAELTQAKRQRVHQEELTAYLRTELAKANELCKHVEQKPVSFIGWTFPVTKSWNDVWTETCAKVNSKNNMKEIISISTVLCCPSGITGVKVYYVLDQNKKGCIKLNCELVRSKILPDDLTKTNEYTQHQKMTYEAIKNIKKKQTRIVSVNDLEINQDHVDNLTLIWYEIK